MGFIFPRAAAENAKKNIKENLTVHCDCVFFSKRATTACGYEVMSMNTALQGKIFNIGCLPKLAYTRIKICHFYLCFYELACQI